MLRSFNPIHSRFTKYRDIRDALHQFEGVVSACLVLAYEELSLVMHLDEVSFTLNEF